MKTLFVPVIVLVLCLSVTVIPLGATENWSTGTLSDIKVRGHSWEYTIEVGSEDGFVGLSPKKLVVSRG